MTTHSDRLPPQEYPPPVPKGALGGLLAPVRKQLAVGVALAALSALLAFVPFIAIAEIGRELLDGDSGRVWPWAIAAVVGFVVGDLIYFGAIGVCHRADARFRFFTRRDVARHVGVLPLGWFLTGGSGRVKRAVSDDVASVHTLVAHVVPDLTTATLAPLIGLTYLFITDWRFALLLAVYMVAVLALTMPRIQQAQAANGPDYELAQQTITTSTVELVDGIAVVKAFGVSGRVFGRFVDAIDRLGAATKRWLSALGGPVNAMTVALAPGTMVVVMTTMGFVLIERGWIDAGDLVAFLAVGVGLPATLMKLAMLSYTIAEANTAAARITTLLAQQPLPVSPRPRAPQDATVEFDGVTFGYEPGQVVLHDVSLRLEAGTVTALVGPSGSGKSTLASLVPRFFDVDAGRVMVGGVDVRDLDQAELLSKLAIVFQDVVLIHGTISDNIRLAAPEADQEAVAAAARAAAIHDEINTLPVGYETVIGGVDGVDLSYGQRQRITIARAILSDAPIVLLDEATAHADPDSESRVEAALSELLADRTVLVVAHRIHTVTGADQIVVLDAGRIVAVGTHSDLVESNALYADLWRADKAEQWQD